MLNALDKEYRVVCDYELDRVQPQKKLSSHIAAEYQRPLQLVIFFFFFLELQVIQ